MSFSQYHDLKILLKQLGEWEMFDRNFSMSGELVYKVPKAFIKKNSKCLKSNVVIIINQLNLQLN